MTANSGLTHSLVILSPAERGTKDPVVVCGGNGVIPSAALRAGLRLCLRMTDSANWASQSHRDGELM